MIQLIYITLLFLMQLQLFGTNKIEFSQEKLNELKKDGVDTEHREFVLDFVDLYLEEDLLGRLFLLEKGEIWLSDDGGRDGVDVEKGNEVLFSSEENILYPLGLIKKLGWNDELILSQSVQFVGSFKDMKGVSKTVIDVKDGRTFFDDGSSLAFEDQIDMSAMETFKNNVCDFFIPSILQKVFLFKPCEIGDKVVSYEVKLSDEIYQLGVFRQQTLTWIEKTTEKDRLSWHEPRVFSKEALQDIEKQGVSFDQKKTIIEILPIKGSFKMPGHEETVFETELALLDSLELVIFYGDIDEDLQLAIGDELFMKQKSLNVSSEAIIPEQNHVVKIKMGLICQNLENLKMQTKIIASMNEEGYTFDDGEVLLFSEFFKFPSHFSGSYYDDWEIKTCWDSTWCDQDGQLTIVTSSALFYTEESLERFSMNFTSGEREDIKIQCSGALRDLFVPKTFYVGDRVSIYKIKGLAKPDMTLCLPEEASFVVMRKTS